MKYWFFDGQDVVGPFEPKELAARPDFSATSLVCPENFSEDQDSWKIAGTFAELRLDRKENPSEKPSAEPEENPASFDEEMDTLLKARSPLGDLGHFPTELPPLEIPKKPAKPGPIEEYFNNIKGEDLGDILGIPDPNENSDMNLARALQKQFNKTVPPPDKEFQPIEGDPFDEFTTEESESEPLPPIQKASPEPKPAEKKHPHPEPGPSSVPISKSPEEEIFLTIPGTQPKEEQPAKESKSEPEEKGLALSEEKPAAPQLPVLGQPETGLPTLPAEEPAAAGEVLPLAEKETPAPAPQHTEAEELLPRTEDTFPGPEEIAAAQPAEEPLAQPEPTPAQEQPKNNPEETVRHILDGKLEVELQPEIPEPIKNVTVETRVNQVRPRLKQTAEIKEFLYQTQNERIKRETSHRKAMAALSVLAALLAVGAAVYLNKTVLQPKPQIAEEAPAVQAAVPAAAPAEDASAEELLPEIPVPPPAVADPSLEQKALLAVQNYQLSANRGTIAAYLDRLYQAQKQKGYIASWSVEPLHKSTYIVKYRLTKTRLEPIVYIFQVDAAQGKLTGALNNITLDLVGKIQ